MTESFTGPPTVRQELNRVMQALSSGVPAGAVESELVDVKEEPGRRDRAGAIQPGEPTNEEAAGYLAGELACLANSGGGAIVLGDQRRTGPADPGPSPQYRDAAPGPCDRRPVGGREPYDAAWQPSDVVRSALINSDQHRPPPRAALLSAYAVERGRISSTEAKSLLHTSANTARSVLDELEREGKLRLGQERRRGRGVFYTPVASHVAAE